jgi:hypothetical protein
MKTSSNTFLKEISKSEIISLTTIVSETIAPKSALKGNRQLNVADLWNIQRKSRTAIASRHYL